MHLILFDIDGTLVDSARYETKLYSEAIAEVLVTPFETDWSRYTNVTDGGILDEIIDKSGTDLDRNEIHNRVKAIFVKKTQSHFIDNPSAIREIRGAKMLINKLRLEQSCSIAIATGCWEETARLKLAGIRVDLDGIPLATCSDAMSRIEIMQIAEARALKGKTPLKKTYFGDRIWDKLASEALGYDFIAVGDAVTHSAVFRDLEAHEEIFRQLGI
jgi:beta-phosphoglucomutase-like phosphatase (HAD superfamily)